MEKIVEFENWCYRCKHFEKDETERPCFECLENPVNIDSRKPTYYEEATTEQIVLRKKEAK